MGPGGSPFTEQLEGNFEDDLPTNISGSAAFMTAAALSHPEHSCGRSVFIFGTPLRFRYLQIMDTKQGVLKR